MLHVILLKTCLNNSVIVDDQDEVGFANSARCERERRLTLNWIVFTLAMKLHTKRWTRNEEHEEHEEHEINGTEKNVSTRLTQKQYWSLVAHSAIYPLFILTPLKLKGESSTSESHQALWKKRHN